MSESRHNIRRWICRRLGCLQSLPPLPPEITVQLRGGPLDGQTVTTRSAVHDLRVRVPYLLPPPPEAVPDDEFIPAYHPPVFGSRTLVYRQVPVYEYVEGEE